MPQPEPSPQVRAALDKALFALKEYAWKVVGWPDPDEAGSQELCDALLEPLVSWEDYQTATTPSTGTASSAGSSRTSGVN